MFRFAKVSELNPEPYTPEDAGDVGAEAVTVLVVVAVAPRSSVTVRVTW